MFLCLMKRMSAYSPPLCEMRCLCHYYPHPSKLMFLFQVLPIIFGLLANIALKSSKGTLRTFSVYLPAVALNGGKIEVK